MNDSSLAETLDRWWFKLRFHVSGLAGRLFNLAGLPGFVRHNQTYEFAGIKARTVVGRWSTTVSVNNVHVKFNRLTGKISGVGVCSPTSEFLKTLSRTGAQPRAHLSCGEEESCGSQTLSDDKNQFPRP